MRPQMYFRYLFIQFRHEGLMFLTYTSARSETEEEPLKSTLVPNLPLEYSDNQSFIRIEETGM